ncbi:MAG TPA: NUDIX domain-containing protein [Rhizomicrobium sp.]|jgi:8-oxo-dGTP pyrophosphatase MutT (NUDIX family)|nr:NUDIX domain-containing protein [Rhizomicrobium sp.]
MGTLGFYLRRFALALGLTGRAFLTPVAFGAHAIVQDRDGRVLLVKHSYVRGWHLPGGGVRGGEPADAAVLREVTEEVGLSSYSACEFYGLYTRKVGPATNVIALYRLRDAEIAFEPNFEIRNVMWADPENPPEDVSPGARRRLAELTGKADVSPYW